MHDLPKRMDVKVVCKGEYIRVRLDVLEHSPFTATKEMWFACSQEVYRISTEYQAKPSHLLAGTFVKRHLSKIMISAE